MKATLLVYDCPAWNPSDALRPYGVRINLSSWVFPPHRVPHLVFNRMTEEKIRWRALDAEWEPRALIAAVTEAILDEIEEAELRCERSIEKAGGDMKKTANAIYRHRDVISDLHKAAEGFGIHSLDAIARARAIAYGELTKDLEGTDMEPALKAHDVHPLIAADFAEERGKDVKRVRRVFNP